MLIRNNVGSGNNWLIVRLIGTVSNRAGIGAVVRVKARIGGRSVWQTRFVAGGPTGNNFQADLRVHFGLAGAGTVDSLVIAWPSGIAQTLRRVPVNRVLSLEEPVTVLSQRGDGKKGET